VSCVLHRNIVSESVTFPANCCNISWKKENVIGAAKQKKHQKEEEIVKKLIKMGTLLKKSLSGFSSAAEMGTALQVPDELPGDRKVDDCDCSDLSINASNYTAAQSTSQTP